MRLSEAARDLKIAIVIGANERVDAGPGTDTLQCAAHYSEDGRLAKPPQEAHPTYTERLVWGNGDGRGLEAVSTSLTHRRIDLLGALDAARTHAMHNPASTSTSLCGDSSRITSTGQQTLRL